MAITLAKAQLLTQDKLWNGVVDELRSDKLLDMMVFDNNASYNGGSTLNYVYNKMDNYSSADFRALNEDYTADEADTKTVTVALKVLGGKYSIDRVIMNHVKGVEEQEAFQLSEKIKAIKRGFAYGFIKGNSTTNAKQFDGLDKLIDSTMVIGEDVNANTIDLSSAAAITSNYTLLTDAFRDMEAQFDGTPTAFFCSPAGYALIQKIADRATGFTVTKDEFGRETFRFNGTLFVPLGQYTQASARTVKQEVIPTSANGNTAFYPVRIGLDAVHAIAPEGNDAGISVYPIDKTSPSAVREGACEMVTAIAVKNARTAGKIIVKVKAVS